MDKSDSFGNFVKDKRQFFGLTQAELARRVGCATITIRKIEADSIRPSVQISELLAVALDIPLEERAAFVRRARQQISETPEPPPAPTPYPSPEEIGGEDLSGRAVRGYQLADRIGEGGFGAVYRAVQPNIEREVAIKIILPRYANNPDFIRRFEAEAQMVARLEHPFIVPLYDYWREPNAAYLVMRLLRGGSLKDELKEGALPFERVISVVEQICQALHIAHRFGVIHRDLKPANILLDEDRNAYLTDFGIAKNLSDPDMINYTQTGALIGSFPYLAPEQIRSESILPQADIYSLGVLIFHLMTGSPPFQGPTPIDYIQQHLEQPIPSLLEYNPGLSPSFENVIQRATAKDVSQRYPDVLSLLQEIRDALQGMESQTYSRLGKPGWREIDSEKIENPYKGLRPFGEADAADFYGRDTLIQELLGQVAVETDLGHFLAIIGPSGSGKSSVINAGLIPALRRGGLPGSENWFIEKFSPGAHPFEAMEAALLRVAVNPPSSLLEQLRSSERGFIRTVQRVLPQDESVELVLVIDQFEELFTLVQDEAIRARFLANLVTLVMDTNSRCHVLITLRADFIDRPLEYVDVGELIRERNVLVLPLIPDEIEESVVRPAVRVGLFPEDELVKRIVRELGDQPGVLPLLQHTLNQLYERRDGNRLTVEAYEEIGGVLGSLGRSAEEAYKSLSEVEQAAAHQLFLRLVTLGEGVEDTRRRVLRTELDDLATKELGMETEKERYSGFRVLFGFDEIETAINAFGKYRLITFDHDPITRTPTVEVAHEALLREWSRLRIWLDESRADIRMQRQLARSSREWEAAGRDSSFLIPGGVNLERFTTWFRVTNVALTKVEQDYLEASVSADRERKEHQLRQERTRQKLLSAFIGALVVGLFVAIGLSVFAFSQQRIASEQRQEALRQASIGLAAVAEKELSGVDQERSVLLALEAVENYPFTSQAAGALAQSIEQFREFRILDASQSVSGLISVAAWSPDGERVAGATSPSPNSVAIWDSATGREILSVNSHKDLCQEKSNLFHDLTWSPAGDRLAVAAQDTNSGAACGVVVLDANSGERLLVLDEYEKAVRSLDWSPDGSVILTGHESGILRMWNAQSGAEISALADHVGPVLDVVFSPDGRRIASASEDGTVRIWNAETGDTQVVLSGHAGAVKSVDWSPDGTRLVTGGNDGLPRVWDASSGETLLVLPGHVEEVVIVTWSADGRRIASQGLDAIIKVWDAATGGLLFQITNAAPEPSTKRGFVEFSPDGDWILAGGTRVLGLRLWDASIPVPKLFGHTFGQEWGGWSPDGTLIATSGEDGSARLWDAVTGQQVGEFPGGSSWGDWSPDGERLVFADGIAGYSLKVWDVKTGDLVNTLTVPGDEIGTHRLLTVDWSPDGSMIATADFRPGNINQALYIWDAETGELFSSMKSEDYCMLGWPRWSPDSTRIATGCIFVDAGTNTPARIWDVASGEELMRLESDFGWTYQTVWSPDGARILVGYEHGVLRIWDIETGEPLITFAGHQGSTDGEWSPDGTLIVSSGFANKSVKIWDAETGEEFLSFFVAGAPLSSEWSPDGTHIIVTGDGLNEPVIKRVWSSKEELVKSARECCVSRELTPEEREQFGLLASR